MIITIDGPVASGKSALAQSLADELGFYYLYTGLLYRGLAYVLAHEYGYSEKDMYAVADEDLAAITGGGSFVYQYIPESGAAVCFHGDRLQHELKTRTLDSWASIISAQPNVREAILQKQVDVGASCDCVADGRDMGTFVFPHAECKIYLTASPQVRAQRWQRDQRAHGNDFSDTKAYEYVLERDERDMQREHSPLQEASDARRIDTSSMTKEETLLVALSYVREVMQQISYEDNDHRNDKAKDQKRR